MNTKRPSLLNIPKTQFSWDPVRQTHPKSKFDENPSFSFVFIKFFDAVPSCTLPVLPHTFVDSYFTDFVDSFQILVPPPSHTIEVTPNTPRYPSTPASFRPSSSTTPFRLPPPSLIHPLETRFKRPFSRYCHGNCIPDPNPEKLVDFARFRRVFGHHPSSHHPSSH